MLVNAVQQQRGLRQRCRVEVCSSVKGMGFLLNK